MKGAKKTFDFGSRLRACIDEANLKYSAFAEKAGVKANALSNYLNNVSQPNYEIISRFVKILDVPADYLLGITDEANRRSPASARRVQSLSATVVAEDAPGYGKRAAQATLPGAESGAKQSGDILLAESWPNALTIAMVGAEALASYPLQYQSPAFLQKLPMLVLPRPELGEGLYRCFQVRGEGMAATLQSGDWAIARQVAPLRDGNVGRVFEIREAQVYVVVTQQDVLIRRLLDRTVERGVLMLKSDNENYQPVEIEGSAVVELWEVRSRISSMLTSPESEVARKVDALEADYRNLLDRLQELENQSRK
jgi:transcriptional regulator with XRE-family HTH domain